MSNDAPIASLLRVERGHAAPEELAAIAVVVACYAAHRTPADRDGKRADVRAGAGAGAGRRRAVRPGAGCWAGCWACR
ncbi:acyl-CoA carboxylase subunit epsilon [Streptomyces sp. NPDC016562]|uniref:acyl-CoA carboxylase subunit epsilon n=1 Tax=Streptomyces sp. NPDC016562 TaxID=3364966 RepID=UPI0036FD3B6D